MIKKFPYHPLILALYPPLALLAGNLDQLRPASALRALAISLLGAAVLYAVFWRLLKKPRLAALLASWWLLLFFSYGHIYQAVEGNSLARWVYGKHRFLAPLWLLLLAAGTFFLVKRLRHTRELTLMLNVTCLALLAFPLAQTAWYELRLQVMEAPEATAPMAAVGEEGPDIYYIVLDSYARSDVLQKLYELDSTPMLDELKSLGFVIPECAQSNYGLTAFSMYASLNMEYLDETTFPVGSDLDRVDYQVMRDYLRHSKVRQYLAERGYQMVTFETGYYWLDIDDSELYIVQNDNPLRQYSEAYQLSNFEDLFIRTTALRIVSEVNAAFLKPLTRQIVTPEEQHYQWVKFALDHLSQVPEIPGKKFVYMHVLAPHDPYVFAPDGSFLYSPNPSNVKGSDIPGYPNEVSYLNSRLVEIVRTLIEKSPTPPIIIIQGDHGVDPRSQYHMQILNAYFLPDGGGKGVYPTITPVNTFRLVLDTYFGEKFGLLEDHSYFSMGTDIPIYGVRSRPYQFTPVPSTCLGDLP